MLAVHESITSAPPDMSMNLRCCMFSGACASLSIVILLMVWLSLRDHSQELELLWRNETADDLLLVFIHSRGDYEGVLRRTSIRETWLSDIDHIEQEVGKGVDYRFVLGGKEISDAARSNLTLEQKKYGDILILEDVTDSHDSLTLRTLRGFQYATEYRLNFSYMFKCDDDTFVNFKALVSELDKRKESGRLYWGEFLGACGVMTDGLYAENSWSVCDTYLPYAFGGGYVISRDLVELISQNANFVQMYKNEDVAVGAWLAPYSLMYQFDARFNTGAVSRGCKRQFIVVHKIPANQMYDYYRAMKRDGYPCNRQNRWFGWHGHIYNWNTLPSKCCKRRRRIP